MVKFEDLEVGKDYILISTNVYTYPSDFYGVQRITIVRKGLAFIKKSIELQASDNERKVYDEIGYLDEHDRSETISTISTYKDKHLNYAFIGLDEDIEKEIETDIEFEIAGNGSAILAIGFHGKPLRAHSRNHKTTTHPPENKNGFTPDFMYIHDVNTNGIVNIIAPKIPIPISMGTVQTANCCANSGTT